MENTTMNGTLQAIAMAHAAGLKATFVDTRRACVAARIHQKNDGFDHCDGCAGHPGTTTSQRVSERAREQEREREREREREMGKRERKGETCA
eukprot:COSAG02_NODE_624_length_19387_cov_90.736002_7_plen_93_part_00